MSRKSSDCCCRRSCCNCYSNNCCYGQNYNCCNPCYNSGGCGFGNGYGNGCGFGSWWIILIILFFGGCW